jgi:3',5'-cyclic AMP phosphodiesterase CpdA
MKIAHISDIHYSKSWTFRPDLLQQCLTMVNTAAPDVVVITGDVTDFGLTAEFAEVTQTLGHLDAPYMVVPGNHDSRHEGYKKFEHFFSSRFFTREHNNYQFIGVDSSEPDLDDGHVGREQLKWMDTFLSETTIVFLHHHLIPVPNTGRERNVLVDAGDVLHLLNRNNVPLVLSGHKHVPWVWDLDGMVVVTAGTVSCERTGVDQSFNLIEITGAHITIDTVMIGSGKRTHHTFERVL